MRFYKIGAVVRILVLLACVATSPAGPPATTRSSAESDINDLYVAALVDMPEFVKEPQTRFIAIGFDDQRRPIDPTPEILKRFTNMKPPVEPASQAKEVGKKQRIYYVIVREGLQDDSVRLAVGFRSSPLSGAGSVVIYKYAGGKWELAEVVSHYVE